MPNKLSQFWLELKRRKVVRVITVYAAVAFIILQLIEILAPSLRLPEWTMNLILVMLIVGFIIAVILSWIYDVNPEGGVVKTEPADKVKTEDMPISSKGWKIASYISFVVIITLIVFNVIPRLGNKEILDKSIAVLPFKNDSPEEEKMGFINGTMEHILDNLTKIENLRVISRTTVEQYRDPKKSLVMIAKEMDVGYILEGSGQRDGGRARITVQLLDARKDMHIWSQTYLREIEDVFDLQSEVARLVAKDLEEVINPDPDQVRVKLTAERQAALNFYQKGLREMGRYWESHYDIEFLEDAEDLFHYTLETDSTFIEPYEQLVSIYYEKYSRRYGDSKVALDSALFMADKAIQIGTQNAETYILKARIHGEFGQYERKGEALEDALALDQENSYAIKYLADYYAITDEVKALEFLFEAHERGSPSAKIIRGISSRLRDFGFRELSRHYLDEAVNLDGDSLYYFEKLAYIGLVFGDFQLVKEAGLKLLAIDSLERLPYDFIALSHALRYQYDSSLVYFRKAESLNQGSIFSPHQFGYVLVQNGEVEEGEKIFREMIEFRLRQHKLDQMTIPHYLDIGALYSFMGEKDKAIEYLKIYTQKDGISFFHIEWLKSPFLDNIRNEPEFKEIVEDAESIVQAKHERVRQWLEENDKL